MMNALKLLTIPLLLAWATGCIKVDQSLTINPDGSAQVEYTYGMAEATVAQMEAMSKMAKTAAQNDPDAAEPENDMSFDEDEIRKKFEEYKADGLRLDSVSSEVKDGWKYITVKYSAKNLEALAKAESFGGEGLSLKKNDEGNYVLTQAGSDFGQGDDETMTPEMKQQMMQQMLPMLKGMRVAIKIKAPGKVLANNGTSAEGDTVSWVYDVDQDPSFLMKDNAMNMSLTFAGKGLNLPEIEATADEEETVEEEWEEEEDLSEE